MKIIDAHKAREGYEEMAKGLQLAVSSVHDAIKKRQLRGSQVEVWKTWRTAYEIARKPNQSLCLTAEPLEEALVDGGVAVLHCSAQI